MFGIPTLRQDVNLRLLAYCLGVKGDLAFEERIAIFNDMAYQLASIGDGDVGQRRIRSQWERAHVNSVRSLNQVSTALCNISHS